jgi:hypothetical protein
VLDTWRVLRERERERMSESGAAAKKNQKTKKGTVDLMWRWAYVTQVEPKDDWL